MVLRISRITERLKLTGLQSLERRRLNYDLILTYKILHGITETSLIKNFSRQEYSRARGHGWKLEKPFCSWDIYEHFFDNRIIDAWNNVPSDVASSNDVSIFKRKLTVLTMLC